MKTTFLTFAILFAGHSIYAQTNRFLDTGNAGVGTTNPVVPFQIVKSPLHLTDVPMQQWNPSIAGYNLTLSNFNSDYGIDYRFTQYTNGIATPVLTFRGYGNVGIGTTSPVVTLHIAKSLIQLTDVPMQEWDPLFAGYNLTLSNFNSSYGVDYRFTQYTNGNPAPVLTFRGGNVGIGTTAPDTKLTVNGIIHSKEVKVDSMTDWPDYVFQPKYDLRSIYDIKLYINKYHHLPDMPSETEVANEGINLGEMNKLLLKKVEELTLYLIHQKEEADKQNMQSIKRNKIQQQQINELKSQVGKLSKQL